MPLTNPVIDLSDHYSSENYDPQLWIQLYTYFNRYLKDIPESTLTERYRVILRNQVTLITPERDIYPYHNLWLSSWFWLRIQIEIETEFKLRNIPVPSIDLEIDRRLLKIPSPIRPKYLNSVDFVVRFGEMSWLPKMLCEGIVQMKHASAYLDANMNPAQKDDEEVKYTYSPGHSVKITNPNNHVLTPLIGMVTYKNFLDADCYILCTSNEFDTVLFHDLPRSYDGCLLIKDVDAFAERMESAWKRTNGSQWEYYHNNVEYWDGYNSNPIFLKNDRQLIRQHVNPISSKDVCFAYQKEYRFWWVKWRPRVKRSLGERTELKLGSLEDIAAIYTKAELLEQVV